MRRGALAASADGWSSLPNISITDHRLEQPYAVFPSQEQRRASCALQLLVADAALPDTNVPATDAIYQRFAGIGGSAYFVGGLGMTALTMNDIVAVPIRTGVGIRLGANVGYLKFTPTATWNPF